MRAIYRALTSRRACDALYGHWPPTSSLPEGVHSHSANHSPSPTSRLLSAVGPVSASTVGPVSTSTTGHGVTLTHTHTFTQPDVDAFCRLTDDVNPIHHAGVPLAHAATDGTAHAQPIVPGILSASLFPSLISKKFPGSLYVSQTLKFRQPILVDEPVEVTLQSQGQRHGLLQFSCAIRKTATIHETAVDGVAIVKLHDTSETRWA